MKRKLTLQDRIPQNRGEMLLLYVKFTKRAIGDHRLPSEQFLVDQLKRIELELEEWKKANKKVKLRNL